MESGRRREKNGRGRDKKLVKEGREGKLSNGTFTIINYCICIILHPHEILE